MRSLGRRGDVGDDEDGDDDGGGGGGVGVASFLSVFENDGSANGVAASMVDLFNDTRYPGDLPLPECNFEANVPRLLANFPPYHIDLF